MFRPVTDILYKKNWIYFILLYPFFGWMVCIQSILYDKKEIKSENSSNKEFKLF